MTKGLGDFSKARRIFLSLVTLITVVALTACSAESSTSSETATEATQANSSEPTTSPVDPNEKVLYFTFDDGPAEDTKPLLKVLRKNDAQATFFVVGTMASNNKRMLKEIHDDGHAIGNHTWSHPDLRELSEAEVRSQLVRLQELSSLIGQCYRAPFGARNGTVLKVAKELDLEHYRWDLVLGDWDPLSVSEMESRLMKSEPGDVVLMHDGPVNRGNTVKAVANVIPRLKAEGFVFKAIPACMI